MNGSTFPGQTITYDQIFLPSFPPQFKANPLVLYNTQLTRPAPGSPILPIVPVDSGSRFIPQIVSVVPHLTPQPSAVQNVSAMRSSYPSSPLKIRTVIPKVVNSV